MQGLVILKRIINTHFLGTFEDQLLNRPVVTRTPRAGVCCLNSKDEEIEVQTVGGPSGTLTAGQFMNWDLSFTPHAAEACCLPWWSRLPPVFRNSFTEIPHRHFLLHGA